MKKLSDYSKLAEERGFYFPLQDITSTRQKHTWQCSNGHKWQASFSNIKYNYSGCPYCAGLNPKNLSDYQYLANQYHLTILNMANNTHTPSTWKCEKGHIFQAPYNRIHNQGKSCLLCSHKIPKIEQDYISLAQSKGIQFLGPVPSSVLKKTNWKCKCGRQYRARFITIQKDCLCKKCGYLKITGPNSSMYNPKLTKEQRIKRRIVFNLTEWTKRIYKKWNYTCQKCGQWSNPRAHHIFNWNHYPEYRTDDNNGIVLCEDCHIDFHCQYGKIKNNLKQIEIFTQKKYPELETYFYHSRK